MPNSSFKNYTYRQMDEALKAVGAKTKKEVIERGLRELIRPKTREALRFLFI